MSIEGDLQMSGLPDESRLEALERMLKAEITSGQRVVGSLLPTEAELCKRTGLSRYAVRKAVANLTDQGLVSRQQGVGTKVLASHPQQRYVQNMGSIQDLFQYAGGTEFRVDERRTIRAAEEAEFLQCEPGDKWLKLAGVRYGPGAPPQAIALVTIYVAARYSNLDGLGKTPRTPVYSLIERNYGVRFSRVQQELRAKVLTRVEAAAVDAEEGSAALLILRRYFVGADLCEVTTGLHPTDRFTYSMNLNLAGN